MKTMKRGEQVQISVPSFYGGATKIALVTKGRKYYTVRPWQGFHISTRPKRILISDIQAKEESKAWNEELMKKFKEIKDE